MKIKMIKKIFFTVLLFLFLSPSLVLAGYDGLIPCGFRGWYPCQLCHVFILLDNVIQFILFGVVPYIAALMVVIGGLIFFLAQGNPAKIQKAKSLFTWLAIGLVLLYGAWVIVTLFFSVIGISDDFETLLYGENWSIIGGLGDCPSGPNGITPWRPAPRPGTDPGADPGADPGTDPGADPGTDPGADPPTEEFIPPAGSI